MAIRRDSVKDSKNKTILNEDQVERQVLHLLNRYRVAVVVSHVPMIDILYES